MIYLCFQAKMNKEDLREFLRKFKGLMQKQKLWKKFSQKKMKIKITEKIFAKRKFVC